MDKKSKGKKPTCFVPECPNVEGVSFPRTAIGKKKWLESLEIEDQEPLPDSFICLDHFEDFDSSGDRERAAKRSLPKRKINKLVKKNKKKEGNNDETERQEKYSESQSTPKSKKGKSTEKSTEIPHPKIGKPRTRSTSHKSGELTEAEIDKELQKLFANQNTYNEHSADDEQEMAEEESQVENAKDEIDETEEIEDITNKCRLCMESRGVLESIYSKIDDKNTILHAMIVCLFPIKITPDDKLSKKICKRCLKHLKDSFKFRSFCLEMDKKQQKYRGIEFDYFSDDEDDIGADDCEEDSDFLNSVNNHIETNERSKHFTKNKDQRGSKKTGNNIKADKTGQKSNMNNEDLLKVLEGDYEAAKEKNQHRKIKQESVSEANDGFENITIDIVQDENLDTSSYKLASSKLPIVIKPIKPVASRNNRKRKSSDACRNADDYAKLIKTGKNEVVVMPKDIKVRMVFPEEDVTVPKKTVIPPSFRSEKVSDEDNAKLGTAIGTLVTYSLDSEFFEADEFLYEFRLTKEDGRNLHCLCPECPAVAHQMRTGRDTFSGEIDLIIPHNHEPFTPIEKKKMMFYHVMRRNMQKNKNYNFKTLYDNLASLDTSIRTMIPLSGVIDGLCKYCPVPDIPTFETFDELFELIEEKCFYKIQFTTTGEQFYQERFECADGSKAIIFANPHGLETSSKSKLIYVDATFEIVKDIFPYHLITVLTHSNGAFYPILYGFVNKASEALYKTIFSFLRDTLAPNLRPQEIVTEYDADIYYALAETYVESRIGGSYFSYVQHLYKATAALSMGKQLETNSSFRNMYYMLLMLPLLPPTTIENAFFSLERQIEGAGLYPQMKPLLEYFHEEWLEKVTPEFFCVHRQENRLFTNVLAPYKKLKNMVVTCKTRNKHPAVIVTVLEKLVELESFLKSVQENPSKQWARSCYPLVENIQMLEDHFKKITFIAI